MLTLVLALLSPTPAQTDVWALPAARPCTADEIRELTAPAQAPYVLTCRASLNGANVSRRILFEGGKASGAALDCGGGSVGQPGARTTSQTPTIAVWARRLDGPRWSRPTDIAIRHCTVHGAVRIWGMGVGGRIDDLRASSRTPGHTAAAQAAAPSHVMLEDVTFAATGSIPLYVGPGVTNTGVIDSRFMGRSDAVAIYLDAESRDAEIRNVAFDIRTGREVIAIDGSASNGVFGNRFALGGRGGVFLYRNCGEDGVIRHQTPSDNVVADNTFSGARLLNPRLVVVGAREGRRSYCGDDRGWSFGSSADDGDHAERNVVHRNRTLR